MSLSDTFLKAGQDFRLAHYVYHRTDRPTAGDGRAILVARVIVHNPVPVSDLTHLEATAIQVILPGRPVKNLAVYLFPSRPLIRDDLSDCFGRGLPALLARVLNAKHVVLNSRLITRRGKLLRDYGEEIPCLIFGPGTTTITHKHLRYSRCLGHRDSERTPVPGVSDFVLCTKLGPPPCTQ